MHLRRLCSVNSATSGAGGGGADRWESVILQRPSHLPSVEDYFQQQNFATESWIWVPDFRVWRKCCTRLGKCSGQTSLAGELLGNMCQMSSLCSGETPILACQACAKHLGPQMNWRDFAERKSWLVHRPVFVLQALSQDLFFRRKKGTIHPLLLVDNQDWRPLRDAGSLWWRGGGGMEVCPAALSICQDPLQDFVTWKLCVAQSWEVQQPREQEAGNLALLLLQITKRQAQVHTHRLLCFLWSLAWIFQHHYGSS